MLKLNIKERPEINVSVKIQNESVNVVIQPLSKKEDVELETLHAGGNVRVKTGKKFRKNPEIELPQREYFSLNLARAKKTWKKWDIADENGKTMPCSEKNIELLFNNHYDLVVSPILERYDELLERQEADEKEEKEELEKN